MRRSAFALLLLLLVLAPAAARAQAPGGRTTTTTEPEASRHLLSLVDRTAWVGDGVDFTVQLRVHGAPSRAQVELSVHNRVTSRSAFERTLTGDGLRSRVVPPHPEPLDTLDPDRDGVIALTVPKDTIHTAGVYPVVVDLLDDDDEVVDTLRTYLVRLPAADLDDDDLQPLGVAVVVPFGTAPSHLDPNTPGPADLPVAELTEVLDAHPDVPINLDATPESIAATREAEPAAVADLAAALGGSEVLPAPWVRLDEAAWARADGDELDRQLSLGEDTLTALLGVDLQPIRVAPEGGGPDQLTALVTHGADELVVAEDDLEPLSERAFPYTPGRPFRVAVGDRMVPTLASDDGLEALAETADVDPVLAAHDILADLAVIAQDEPDSPRVATLVLPSVAVDPTFLGTLLAGLEPPTAPPPVTDPTSGVTSSIPAARPVAAGMTLAHAFGDVEPAGADGGADAEDPLVRRLDTDDATRSVAAVAGELARRRADLASYRGIFGPADDLGRRVEQVLSTAASAELEPSQRAAAFTAVDGAVGAQLEALVGPQKQTVTLTARRGRVQLRINNDTGRPADVVLLVRADRLVLPDAVDGRIPVHLAGASTRVDLRVETRSSGDTTIDIQLASPDGRLPLGPSSRIRVRATAVSGVGILLMGAAAAFLAAWWTRTILRDRRAARPHPAHARS